MRRRGAESHFPPEQADFPPAQMQPRVQGEREPSILRDYQNDMSGPAQRGQRTGQLCAHGSVRLTQDDARKPLRKQSRGRERIRQALGIRKKPKRRQGSTA